MPADLFLQSQSPSSHRYAVLEDDGVTAFLYLTEPGVPRPVKDVIVYSRVPPVEKLEWERIKTNGEPPRLRADVASTTAVVTSPEASEFAFQWSADGEAVAVLRNGIPMAMATTTERFGYSKAVTVASPFANPWSESHFQALFQH
jgi:hypothetical protein